MITWFMGFHHMSNSNFIRLASKVLSRCIHNFIQ